MKRVALAFLLAGISAPAFAQATRETLSDAVTSAFENNPEILAQRTRRASADETLAQARAQMLPQVNLSGTVSADNVENGRFFTTPDGQTIPSQGNLQRDSVGFEARQSIYSGGALTGQRRAAEAGVSVAGGRLRSEEQQLVLDVVTAFVDVRRAEEEFRIRTENVDALKQQVRAASDRFNVGEVTRTDVAQAQSRAAGSESALAAARARLAAARANYERLVGRPGIQLAEPPAAPALPGTLEEAVSTAMRDNPDLAASRAAQQQAEGQVAVAEGGMRPRVDLVGSANLQDTYADSSFRDTNAGVRAEVRIPLFSSGLLSSRTRQARLDVDRTRLETRALERQVTQRTTQAWHNVLAAREAIQASTSRVDAARVALEGAQQELAVGTRITLDVLDQETELLEAQLSLVDSQRQAYVAVHELLAAMGRLSPDVVGR
jgi:outer membrane protein